jgi:hypothetical protein
LSPSSTGIGGSMCQNDATLSKESTPAIAAIAEPGSQRTPPIVNARDPGHTVCDE